ncbi:hypothetical protein BC834DRAFT_850481 [Gloeopeniophorella convolvens]|nr:hypothetical protein BC834DRAFT_850481 [Gloeopeniophorella convolvens]
MSLDPGCRAMSGKPGKSVQTGWPRVGVQRARRSRSKLRLSCQLSDAAYKELGNNTLPPSPLPLSFFPFRPTTTSRPLTRRVLVSPTCLQVTTGARFPMPKEKKAAVEKPEKKTRSSGGGGRKKLTAYNKFMQTEMARLKEDEPDISHQERFKLATANWKTSRDNPKAEAS